LEGISFWVSPAKCQQNIYVPESLKHQRVGM
jgi:hypothetical protein